MRRADWEQKLCARIGAPAIEAWDELDSTNIRAKDWARQGAPHGALVIAGAQTAGRGRLGRAFVSPPGAGLYMTVIVWPKDFAAFESLTIAAAVAGCEAIEALTHATPGIKWVNDLMLNGKKICGILSEAVVSPGGARGAVVGIGVNLQESLLPEPLREIAGALDEPVDRDELAARIWENLMRHTDAGGDALIEAYRSRSILIGQDVRYCERGEWREARVEGVGGAGELLVRTADGEARALRAGEVTMHRGDAC